MVLQEAVVLGLEVVVVLVVGVVVVGVVVVGVHVLPLGVAAEWFSTIIGALFLHRGGYVLNCTHLPRTSHTSRDFSAKYFSPRRGCPRVLKFC